MPFDSVGGNDPSQRPSSPPPRPVETPFLFFAAVWLTAGILGWAIVGLTLTGAYNGMKAMVP